MSNASEKPPRGQSSSSQSPFPPPQISDLLVLTLTTAYGMTWMGAFFPTDPPTGGADWRDRLDELATTLLPGLLFGLELFGFAVVVRELVRGRPFASLAPGHWWFLFNGPLTLLNGTHYLIALIAGAWFENQQGLWRMIESLSSAAFCLCYAAVWLWATASLRGWPWRVVLGFKALEQLDWLVIYCFRAFRGFAWAPRPPATHLLGLLGTIHVGLILSVAAAVAADFRTRTRRDWLHHLAAVAIVAESLHLLFGGFGAYLVRWWSAIWLHVLG